MTDIFISYSRQDQAWVSKLAAAFDGMGYDVWWDTQLLAGEDFQHIIPAELEKAHCVVVVWSKTSVTRKWVRSEATRADNRGVLIPVRCEAAEIPMPLDLLHAEDMQGWNGKPEHPAFQKLLQAVTRHCPRPKIPGGSESMPEDPIPLPPKKFPWLPALFLSTTIFGGGYYWQWSSVGASPAGDSSMQQSNYTIHNDGTVTDTKTNLMWKQCSEGQSGNGCSGAAARYKWDDTMSKFRSNVSFAGYSDWRMPTKDELRTLVYCSNGTSQATANGCGDNYQNYQRPTIDLMAFPNTPNEGYWSSTVMDASIAMMVFFNTGSSLWYGRIVDLPVRLVRSVQ